MKTLQVEEETRAMIDDIQKKLINWSVKNVVQTALMRLLKDVGNPEKLIKIQGGE